MDKFFSNSQSSVRRKIQEDGDQVDSPAEEKKSLPKGVVIGKDGKPCRSCTSVSSWMQMAKANTTSTASKDSAALTATASTTTPEETLNQCPPDVEALGRSTWTFLHALTASYPPKATVSQQSDMKQFLHLFSKLYPCWHCAEDFQEWMHQPGNDARVRGQDELGTWMCEAHNEVNRKLGKQEFDCRHWRERWVDGPTDGRCG